LHQRIDQDTNELNADRQLMANAACLIILWARGTWNLVMLVYLAYIMHDGERSKECKSVSREA